MERDDLIGSVIEYVDEYGKPHPALVTQVWTSGGPEKDKPGVNLVLVSPDERNDQYGRQIDRKTSVVHEANQPAHGFFWRELASS